MGGKDGARRDGEGVVTVLIRNLGENPIE